MIGNKKAAVKLLRGMLEVNSGVHSTTMFLMNMETYTVAFALELYGIRHQPITFGMLSSRRGGAM